MYRFRYCRLFRQRFVLPVAKLIRIGCRLGALGIVLIGVQHLAARETAEVNATYGRGVHAYFANDSHLAVELFTQSIQAGSTDPRVFYFRAMSRLIMGQQAQAEEDMQRGATFEANRPSSRLSVNQALQRVQGTGRILLEGFRRQAQLDQALQRRQRTQLRYERLRHREELVLRSEAFQPQLPEEVAQPTRAPSQTSFEPASVVAEDKIDPFSEPAVSDDDPFAEPAELETEPAASDDDPFAETTPMSDEAASASVGLAESGKMESGQLLGVLQRVLGRALPWSGLPRRRVRMLPGVWGDAAGDPIRDIELGPKEQLDDFGDFGGEAVEDEDPFGGMDEEDPFEVPQSEESDANDGDQPAPDREENPFGEF